MRPPPPPPRSSFKQRPTDPQGVSEREPWGLQDPGLTGGGRAASAGLYLLLFSVCWQVCPHTDHRTPRGLHSLPALPSTGRIMATVGKDGILF